jgi:hypothetical protein
MENSGKETKTREDRREAAPARVPALVGAAAPSAAGSGGAGDLLPIWSKPGSLNTRREKPIELWWHDEARVWAKRGSRPPAPRESTSRMDQHIRRRLSSSRYGAALVLPYANAQAVNLHLEGDLQPSDARQSRRLHLYGNDCGTHVIDNIGKKTGGKMGNFTLGCRRVGRQVQATTARATAATIRRDVARITRRRRQIRGGEIIFSVRRDRILDMV